MRIIAIFILLVSSCATAATGQQSNPFLGDWIYRSFHDNPNPADDFNDIRLWEASLSLATGEGDSIVGVLKSGEYELKVSGEFDLAHTPPSIKLNATGIDGTKTEGWRYDYVGNSTHRWTDGDEQRPVITGTVIRTRPHSPRSGFKTCLD